MWVRLVGGSSLLLLLLLGMGESPCGLPHLLIVDVLGMLSGFRPREKKVVGGQLEGSGDTWP